MSYSVDETEENGKKVIDMLDRVVKSSEDFGKKIATWNNSMADELEILRNKITKARQIADGVSQHDDVDFIKLHEFFKKNLDPSIDFWSRERYQ